MNISRLISLAVFGAIALAWAGCGPTDRAAFHATHPVVERPWIGPEYWSNPLQDWRIREGRIECLTRRANRNVALLVREVAEGEGDVHLRVRLGVIASDAPLPDSGRAGFRIGARGAFHDHRDTALRGSGLDVGVTALGRLFIGASSEAVGDVSSTAPFPDGVFPAEGVFLDMRAVQREDGRYNLRLRLGGLEGEILGTIEAPVDADVLTGGLALVVDFDAAGLSREDTNHPSFWFEDWQVDGTRVRAYPERTFGPILFAMHTLSKGSLYMTAQMPPLSDDDAQEVRLTVRREGQWEEVGRSPIDPMARTATFAVADWPDSLDMPYRLAYDLTNAGGNPVEHVLEGTVRRDPVDQEEIVVAGFTGNNDLGFPHADLVRRVAWHDPDILLFTGDNIYEGIGGYGYVEGPLDTAMLDYLRKWYLFGWEYGELTKDIPTVAIPDDHDVYHGNVWGAGGKATGPGATKKERQDTGGYVMPASWVNAVQRTQTAHFPPPYDPAPVEQGIGVYYTDLVYGGISFGIIEDRKWKDSPKVVLPARLDIENGWAENQPTNPPEALHAPTADLLGRRQLDFLEHWAADWSHGTWMKFLMSQTIFANVATLPQEAPSDVVVPRLEIFDVSEYAPNDRIVQDMDSNGWPKHGRDAALRAIRKGFAFHLAGDQHLGSTIRYGVDAWGDAGYALCVPSVANVYPRRWYPPISGANRPEGAPKNMGDFLDGFGNHMTVLAVSNPYETGMEPTNLYDRAPGYGIVRLNREARTLDIANWPRHVDPEDGEPYPGWPISIRQMDNYGREAAGWLPQIRVRGMEDPVVQVIDEASGEIVYTLRIAGTTFSPKVFATGSYTLHVGDPDGAMQTFTGVRSASFPDASALDVVFGT